VENRENTFSREGNTITHVRLLQAPRELVWEVWTDPEHIKEWFGPMGFTLTNDTMTVKPSGEWNFTMHGMGRDFPNRIKYKQVIKPSLITYHHSSDKEDKYSFDVTVTFEQRGNNTVLTMKSIFQSAEVLDELNKAVNAFEGGKQTLNRLETYLNDQLKKKNS
jgi:uncharacterized protein YndB with AHSA1/START domain